MRAALQDARLFRRNLCSNPSFEVDTSLWAAALGTLARSTAQALSGSASALLTATDDGNSAIHNGPYVSPNLYPATPGEVYTISAHFRPATTVRDVRIDYAFVTAAGGSLGYINTIGQSISEVAGDWVRWSLTTPKAPATAAKLRILPYVAGTTPGEQHFVDDILIEPGAALRPYFDGNSLRSAWLGTPNASPSAGYHPLA